MAVCRFCVFLGAVLLRDAGQAATCDELATGFDVVLDDPPRAGVIVGPVLTGQFAYFLVGCAETDRAVPEQLIEDVMTALYSDAKIHVVFVAERDPIDVLVPLGAELLDPLFFAREAQRWIRVVERLEQVPSAVNRADPGRCEADKIRNAKPLIQCERVAEATVAAVRGRCTNEYDTTVVALSGSGYNVRTTVAARRPKRVDDQDVPECVAHVSPRLSLLQL